jgi:hypothetical protein
MYGIGESAAANRTLSSILSSDNLFLRLEALTVLENMGRDALPSLSPIKEMIANRGDKKMKDQPTWKAEHDVKVATRIVSTKF